LWQFCHFLQIYLHISFFCCIFAPENKIVERMMSETSVIQQIRAMGEQVLPKGSNLWLYGSRARGDYRPDSDWDLIVLLDKDKQQLQDFDRYAYPFVEMGWQIGEEINPMLYTRSEWEKRHFTPFYHNVEDDKMVIV
jgi:predicted nucleotidyltransferase